MTQRTDRSCRYGCRSVATARHSSHSRACRRNATRDRSRAVADLPEHVFAPRAFGQPRSVAHAVATDQDDPRIRPRLQDTRQSTHDDMEAAIGLEVAGDVADQFLALGAPETLPSTKSAFAASRIRVRRTSRLTPSASTEMRSLRPVWIGRALEQRWCLAMSAVGQRPQVDRVLGAHTRAEHRGIGREFGIEAHVVFVDMGRKTRDNPEAGVSG